MAGSTDLNPLNSPSAGELLGADFGPGAIPGTYMGKGSKAASVAKTLYGKSGRLQPFIQPPKTRYDVLRTQYDFERASWIQHWLDLKRNFLPYRTRWLDDGGQPNIGNKKTQYIIDNVPLLSIRTLAAGLMSGITNPSRGWFRIKTHDEKLYDMPGVAVWCEAVTNALLSMLGRSNYYDTMEPIYRELGTFGTSAHGGYEVPYDARYPERSVINYVPYTAGEYWIGQDSSQRVDVFMRKFRWTAEQVVNRFVTDPYDPSDPKWANIAPGTMALWRSRRSQQRIEVVHVLEPNKDFVPGSPLSTARPVRSVFYERGGNPAQLLEVGGYRRMPVHVARWDLNSDDAYGHSPAMESLGDAKALQTQQRRLAQAIDKHVDPPLIGDANLKKTRVSMLPGDVTWLEGAAANSYGLKPLYQVQPEIKAIIDDIMDTRRRIKEGCYADVFQMLKNMGTELKSNVSATEIQARQQERLLELGPLLNRLNGELFTPQIEQLTELAIRRSRMGWQYVQAGKPVPKGIEMLIPPPPPALKGKPLRIDFISILAQAQRMNEIQGIQQLVTYVLSMAPTRPDVLDKIDFDSSIDIVADRLSVPPEVIVSTDQANKIRKIRSDKLAQQQQQQQQLQTAQVGAQALKNLGDTPLGGGSALDHLAGMPAGGNA